MFDGILKGIGTFLKWIDGALGSYMLTLFIFALIVEIVMLPLAIYQQKNSIKQAKLRPREMAIKKKYAGRDDRNSQMQMQQEIQDLYQRENFSQFAGCLPMLIQLPIIMALYQVVINPLLYVMHMSQDAINAIYQFIIAGTDAGGLGLTVKSASQTMEFVGIFNKYGLDGFSGLASFVDSGSVSAIEGLKGKGAEIYAELESAFAEGFPHFDFFGVDLSMIPQTLFSKGSGIDWLLILVPVLTFASYYFSLKFTRKFTYQAPAAQDQAAMGCSTKMMDITMPLLSTYFAFIMPAAIGIYWMFKSLIGTLKQFIMSKAMPMPQFTEQDYKDAEREMAGKPKRRRKTGTNGEPKAKNPNAPRSLHRIDEDDELPYGPAVSGDYIKTHGTELSTKSPYYDGIVEPEPEKDEPKDEHESPEQEKGDEKTEPNGMFEQFPVKDDKPEDWDKKK